MSAMDFRDSGGHLSGEGLEERLHTIGHGRLHVLVVALGVGHHSSHMRELLLGCRKLHRQPLVRCGTLLCSCLRALQLLLQCCQLFCLGVAGSSAGGGLLLDVGKLLLGAGDGLFLGGDEFLALGERLGERGVGSLLLAGLLLEPGHLSGCSGEGLLLLANEGLHLAHDEHLLLALLLQLCRRLPGRQQLLLQLHVVVQQLLPRLLHFLPLRHLRKKPIVEFLELFVIDGRGDGGVANYGRKVSFAFGSARKGEVGHGGALARGHEGRE
mmetsp:Transcript_129/g.444  ORF Transcript_129/g.444 Transcript_129/m.444 type:complete len:269 (-) Transcript_129:1863-2669(-)